MFECTAVHPTTRSKMNFGLYTEEHRDEFKKLTSAVHEAGGRIGVQLLHCGFVYRPFLYEGVRCLDVNNMSKADIDEIVSAFGKSAKLAVEAGFDTMEFHAAHTYLAHEFLSASMNQRTDEYGGSLETGPVSPSSASVRCAGTCQTTCRCSCVWTCRTTTSKTA